MTGGLLKILLFAFAILICGWLFVSPIVFIWWFLDPDTRDRFTELHEKIATVVFIGSFFSLVLILGQGIEELLVFIPSDWGGYGEDGDFVTTRNSIARTLAFFLSFFFLHVFRKFENMRNENKYLSAIEEIQSGRTI